MGVILDIAAVCLVGVLTFVAFQACLMLVWPMLH